jgi:probable HAF family extracellular repeat protein
MNKASKFSTIIGLSLGCQLIALNAVQAGSFQGLGDLPGGSFRSDAFSVSGDGSTVVGTSDIGGNNEAFRWTQETGIIGLGNNSIGIEITSQAFGVSQDGSVIVGPIINFDNGVQAQGFRWTQETGIVGLGDLPGGTFSSTALGVSNDGSVIAGNSNSFNGGEAFRWTQETGMQALAALSGETVFFGVRGISGDGSVIVGGNAQGAVRWTQEEGTVGLGYIPGGELIPGARSRAEDASSDGSVIVGFSSSPNSINGFEAFRWTEDTGMVGLGILGNNNSSSVAEAVSADGSVIVGRSNGAFIWDEINGMRNLQQVLINEFGLDLTGWQLLGATGISDDGKTIVGQGTNPSGSFEAWIARLDSVTDPDSPTSINREQPSGTPGEDFIELSNGSSDWFVTIPANSLAGSTMGEDPFAPGGRLWDVPHGTGRSVVNGSNLSISIQPPPELTLNGIPITEGTFNLTSIIAYLANGSEIAITPPDPIFANIGDLTEHLLFDVPLDTEVIHLLGFFDPSNPDLDPANFDITIGPLSDTEQQWTFYLPATTDMTTVQVTNLGNGAALDDNTNYFLDLDGNTTSVPEPSSLLGLFLLTGFGVLVKKNQQV